MATKMFDKILKILRVAAAYTAGTIVSTELDFDIPRGFLVKIHDVTLENHDIHEDLEGISADKAFQLACALIKDPDDTTTVAFVNNRVDHDVLMVLTTDVLIVANAADTSLSMYVGRTLNERNFTQEGLDVFTARNMRLNMDAFGTDLADATESIAEVLIHYTLEKISDEDIINLLDIL